MSLLEIDHFAVACETLSHGVEYVQDTLGVLLSAEGQHPKMGTHNQLLSLGPQIYLEVISIDPTAPSPAHKRWFGLDDFHGPPRLINWICRTDDLDAAIDNAPTGIGAPMAFERGKFQWEMAVPTNGRLPFDGFFPALIQWHGKAHPASELPEVNCRLSAATLRHPRSEELVSFLQALKPAQMVQIQNGVSPGLELVINTPSGERILR